LVVAMATAPSDQGMAKSIQKIEAFGFQPGQTIGDKYVIDAFLGGGLEGEVYRVTERRTRVHRAAKFFYPHENAGDRAARVYARKLERVRGCPIAIEYHHAETVIVDHAKVTCLISDYVDGMLLDHFVEARPGKRLPPFEALHVLYALVHGLEQIHELKEYHGDLHGQNILVLPRGIFFQVKVVDFYNLGRASGARQRDDIVDVARLLHWMTGGARAYAGQPPVVRQICCGLRRDRILRRFPNARRLRTFLESFPALDAF